jgi:hypothetical protein
MHYTNKQTNKIKKVCSGKNNSLQREKKSYSKHQIHIHFTPELEDTGKIRIKNLHDSEEGI